MLIMTFYFDFILFLFISYLMSICNPIGYDRLENLYIYKKSSLVFMRQLFISLLSCRIKFTTFWDFFFLILP